MPTIKVFEYTQLVVDNLKFKKSHFKQLVTYNEKHKNKYFNVGNNRIYFKNYVGVIQVGNLTIEILPKTDNPINDYSKNEWHNVLIQMLHISGYLPIESISLADLNLQNMTLIELLYKIFINEVKTIAHSGLLRRYRYKTENLNFFKGRLIFNKHISENYLHKELFYSEHQVYDHNNVFNKIIKKALLVLKKSFKRKSLYSDISNLCLSFDDIGNIKITNKLFERLKFSRNTQRYKRAITLARMILQNFSPDIKSGKNNVIGILFDMNTLFEKVVYQILKKFEYKFKSQELILTKQKVKKFWKNKTIRPDIFGEYKIDGNKKCFVIDTKWKIPHRNNPSNADLKQIFTYNIQFCSNRGILLYPKCKEINGMFEKPEITYNETKTHSCSILSINLIGKDGKINFNAGFDTLNSILNH